MSGVCCVALHGLHSHLDGICGQTLFCEFILYWCNALYCWVKGHISISDISGISPVVQTIMTDGIHF